MAVRQEQISGKLYGLQQGSELESVKLVDLAKKLGEPIEVVCEVIVNEKVEREKSNRGSSFHTSGIREDDFSEAKVGLSQVGELRVKNILNDDLVKKPQEEIDRDRRVRNLAIASKKGHFFDKFNINNRNEVPASPVGFEFDLTAFEGGDRDRG